MKDDMTISPPLDEPASGADLWARPGFLIRRLHQLSVAVFHDEMAGIEITPVQYGALSIIQRNPGLDQTSLGVMLGIDRASSADVAARLKTAGYIARGRSESDGRVRVMWITPTGRDLLQLAHRRFHNIQKRLLEPLNDEERRVFLELVRRLVVEGNHLGRTTLQLEGQLTA